MKKVGFLMFLAVIVAGCVSDGNTGPIYSEKYICPDGSTANSSAECEMRWVVVKSFSGSADYSNTEPFHVSGSLFETNFRFTGGQNSLFSYYIYNSSGMVGNFSRNESIAFGAESFYTNGDFSIEFDIQNMSEWSLIIREYV